MVGWQKFVAIAEVVLAELAGGVTQRLESLRNRDVSWLQACGAAWHPHFRQSRPPGCLTSNKRRAAGCATVLRIVVSEDQAFFCDPVDVRRLEAHHAHAVRTDIRQADVVAKDDEDVWFL